MPMLPTLAGMLLMLNTPIASSPIDELSTSGASIVWTDPSDRAIELRRLIEQGDFASVQRVATTMPPSPLREEALDMLSRIRRDFAFDAERV
ncbi:MAG TPA: hypothetical protein PKB10_05895, partial [Tepidisphaeraceae bacterium]|nr:hypothetical protein [Tepidisphaeraceae bacterium]